MKSIKAKTTFVFLSLMLLSNIISAQSLKEASPAEKKILKKPVSVIQSLLDQFGNNNWGESDTDTRDYDLLVPINYNGIGPIPLNEDFERIYIVQENSERFNTLLKPMNLKLQALYSKFGKESQDVQSKSLKEQEDFSKKPNPTLDSITAIGNKMEKLNEVDVYAYINDDYIDGNPINDPGINVRGADMVTKQNRGYYQKDYWTTYYMAFGNWKGIKKDKEFKCYYYKFKKTKTSSIQNIVIVLTGAPDRMKELMNKIDWSVLNNALTD